jgi:predicted transcriptional regulator
MESIVSVTRKGATCTELLTCLYDLKPMDMEILYETARNEQATLDEISNSVKRDRSTVHRSLSKLVSLNLVYKRMRTLKEGGYYHVYTLAEEPQIKNQVNLRAKEIIQSLQRLVNRFESDFHSHLRTNRN